ncbi:MAG: AAA family ATPase [Parcubacteria group bacterium]|nr:AAA family ATPase [Parcubacteria group bacterium]
MQLRQIFIDNFKSFARPTTLMIGEGITAIVGPNGCGKSNIADAVRFALGTERVKELRTSRFDDLFFRGTKAARRGMLRCALMFQGDGVLTETKEGHVTMERRLLSDGTGSVLLNGQEINLSELTESLGHVGLASSGIHLIGQGEVASVLTVRDEERKALLDRAFGILPYQMKRDRALRRLARTQAHMDEVNRAIHELTPRAHELGREVKRIAERGELIARIDRLKAERVKLELIHLNRERSTLDTSLATLKDTLASLSTTREAAALRVEHARAEAAAYEIRLRALEERHAKLQATRLSLSEELRTIERKLGALTIDPAAGDAEKTQAEVTQLEEELTALTHARKMGEDEVRVLRTNLARAFETLRALTTTHAVSSSNASPTQNVIPLLRVRLEEIYQEGQALLAALSDASSKEIQTHLITQCSQLVEHTKDILENFLPSSSPETPTASHINAEILKLQRECETLQNRVADKLGYTSALEHRGEEIRKRLAQLSHYLAHRTEGGAARDEAARLHDRYRECTARAEELTKEATACGAERDAFLTQRNTPPLHEETTTEQLLELAVREARLREELSHMETRRAEIIVRSKVLATELGQAYEETFNLEIPEGHDPEEVAHEIARLEGRLAATPEVDPLITKEYEELSSRITFLKTQHEDLTNAHAALTKLTAKLDRLIATRFERAFHELNREFGHTFQELFHGGEASLVMTKETPVTPTTTANEGGLTEDEENDETETHSVGIGIQARPPGKRLRSIKALSGGEQTLTAVALLVAMVRIFPPPFLLLDEVDAALDDANAVRFAAILKDLTKRSQIIAITHNKITMHESQVLYGVLLDHDGSSKLVSLKLDGEPAQELPKEFLMRERDAATTRLD